MVTSLAYAFSNLDKSILLPVYKLLDEWQTVHILIRHRPESTLFANVYLSEVVRLKRDRKYREVNIGEEAHWNDRSKTSRNVVTLHHENTPIQIY